MSVMNRKSLVLGLALFLTSVAASQALAAIRTAFDDATVSPRGNLTIRNGQSVTFTGVLKGGASGLANAPVNIYIGNSRTAIPVKTDRFGRFNVRKTVRISGAIPKNGVNVNWCAEFLGDSKYGAASTCNYIHGWRFTVKP